MVEVNNGINEKKKRERCDLGGGYVMNSLERVTMTLQHKEADRVPVYPIINSVSRKALGISYEEWTKDVDLCAEAIIKNNR